MRHNGERRPEEIEAEIARTRTDMDATRPGGFQAGRAQEACQWRAAACLGEVELCPGRRHQVSQPGRCQLRLRLRQLPVSDQGVARHALVAR